MTAGEPTKTASPGTHRAITGADLHLYLQPRNHRYLRAPSVRTGDEEARETLSNTCTNSS